MNKYSLCHDTIGIIGTYTDCQYNECSFTTRYLNVWIILWTWSDGLRRLRLTSLIVDLSWAQMAQGFINNFRL